MTLYQVFLLAVLVMWPFMIFGLLYLMSRLETYVARMDAHHPQEAGLEPVPGSNGEREVRIVFGDSVIGEND